MGARGTHVHTHSHVDITHTYQVTQAPWDRSLAYLSLSNRIRPDSHERFERDELQWNVCAVLAAANHQPTGRGGGGAEGSGEGSGEGGFSYGDASRSAGGATLSLDVEGRAATVAQASQAVVLIAAATSYRHAKPADVCRQRLQVSPTGIYEHGIKLPFIRTDQSLIAESARE